MPWLCRCVVAQGDGSPRAVSLPVVATVRFPFKAGPCPRLPLCLARSSLATLLAARAQAWATMEAAQGNLTAARGLYASAVRLAPSMPHTYCAWAVAEAAAGNVGRARQLFQEGEEQAFPHAPLLHVRVSGRCDRAILFVGLRSAAGCS